MANPNGAKPPQGQMVPQHVIDLAANGELVGRNFDYVHMRGINLSGVNLTNCSFRGADLHDANFSGATMIRCDFSRADLTWCDFTNADLTDSDFSLSHARGAVFLRAKMRNSIIRQVIWKQCIFAYADLFGSEMLMNNMLGTRWYRCKGLETVRYPLTSIFAWYRKPNADVPPLFEPQDGYVKLNDSATGGLSFTENMGGEKAMRDDETMAVLPMAVTPA